jgi:hypothetical protein
MDTLASIIQVILWSHLSVIGCPMSIMIWKTADITSKMKIWVILCWFKNTMTTIVRAHRIKLSGPQYLPIIESVFIPSIIPPKLLVNSSSWYLPLCARINYISRPIAIASTTSTTIDRTDEANLKGVPKLSSLRLMMLAISRGGAWECKRARGPFQNSQFFNFSLGT